MDLRAASELRAAKREAAKVLREHGVHAQVVVDANATESPHPGPAAGGAPPPTSQAQGMAPAGSEGAARANPVGTRIREAFTRWATRSKGDPHVGHRRVRMRRLCPWLRPFR
jgi:hypothetical protein